MRVWKSLLIIGVAHNPYVLWYILFVSIFTEWGVISGPKEKLLLEDLLYSVTRLVFFHLILLMSKRSRCETN